jgi:hypothetical protein
MRKVERALPVLLAIALFVAGLPAPGDDDEVLWPLLSYGDPAYVGLIRDSAGPHGWERPFAWDAFSDGSVNPAGTAYAVRTAFALYALLDADAIGPQEQAIAAAWNACCFTDGFWWYSEHDPIYTPNASAMMAGVMQRMGYTEQADAAIRRLVASADPGPVWRYSEATGAKVNDLIHHVYTLWGIEQYRTHGGAVEIPWTAEEAAAAMAERTDVADWPGGGPAARYAFAACFASAFADSADLRTSGANPRDDAHRVWAMNVC